jgi:hypothetical protein
MNVERLHLIALELHNDLMQSGLLTALSQLADALQSLAASPGDPNYQQQVSSARTKSRLRPRLRRCARLRRTWPPWTSR